MPDDELKPVHCKCGSLERHLDRLKEIAVRENREGKIQVSAELVNEKCRCPGEHRRLFVANQCGKSNLTHAMHEYFMREVDD